MNEADILADRIIIIGNGNLLAAGSSFFLKRKFADGIHLNMLVESVNFFIFYFMASL